MSDEKKIRRFTQEEEQENTRLARLEYGPDTVNESIQKWNSYSEEKKDAIMAEQDAIYRDMTQAMEQGLPAHDPDVQAMFERWHDHIRYFYEPTLDILAGLAELYVNDERFRATFEAFHPELPEYLQDGIVHYVDELETTLLHGDDRGG